MALTDTNCRNAKGAEKDYSLTDGHGLHLLVKPNGSRLWRMSYRFGGRQRTLSLGRYPAVSLADARELLREARRQIAFGKDPADERKARAREDAKAKLNTVEALGVSWHQAWRDGKTERAVSVAMRLMKRDIFAYIGKHNVAEIDTPTLLEIIRRVEGRGTITVAQQIRWLCNQIFDHAVAMGLTKFNPTPTPRMGLKKRAKIIHSPKISMKEMPLLLAKLEQFDGYDMAKYALEFIILTWVRGIEARAARWAEFENLNGKEPLWIIPAERMKMGREHVVPLSRQAVELLKRVPRNERSSFVFWSDKSRFGHVSTNSPLFALYSLGYKDRQTVHGFRRVASTWANEEFALDDERFARRYNSDWVEMQLAHKGGNEIRGIYNSAEYIIPRRRMLADWADTLDQLRKLGRAKLRDIDELA